MGGHIEDIEIGRAERVGDAARNRYGATIHVANVRWDIERLAGVTTIRDLEFHVVQAQHPGFLVAVNSGTHGDEDTSIEAAYRITTFAKKELRRGTFVCLPQANPEAVRAKKRGVQYMTVADGTDDLNRASHFESVRPLTRIQRHAKAILDRFYGAYQANLSYESFRPRSLPPFPGLLIDLHTEDLNTGSNVIPYTRLDPTTNDSTLAFMMYCSEILGIPWAMEEMNTDEFENSLTGYAVGKIDMPALTIELGRAGSVDPTYAQIGLSIVTHLMEHFGMVSAYENQGHRLEEQYIKQLGGEMASVKSKGPLQLIEGCCSDEHGNVSTAKGVLALTIEPGQAVRKGEPIGNVIDYTQWPLKHSGVYAKENCTVLSTPGSSIVEYLPGDVVYEAAVQVTDERIVRLYNAVRRKLERDGIHSRDSV